jgi:hypothetical protein
MSYFHLGKSALRYKPTDQITTTHDKFGSGGADGRTLYIADFERHLSGIIFGTKEIVTIGHYEYLSIVAAMHRTKL